MSDEYTGNEETEISEDDIDKIMENIDKVENLVEQKAPAPAPTPISAAPVVEKKERVTPTLVKNNSALSNPEPVAGPRQTLALELNGTINLKLSFRSGERSIEVFCTDDALVCRMADGTEFRVPIGTAADSQKRKTA